MLSVFYHMIDFRFVDTDYFGIAGNDGLNCNFFLVAVFVILVNSKKFEKTESTS